MADIIKVEHLSYVYNPGLPTAVTALDDVSFTVEEGDFVGIIGATGSGKSTLITHMNGLNKPTSGKIYIDGRDLWADPEKIRDFRFLTGLVFQYPEYQLFEETCYKDIAFGPKNMGLPPEEIQRRCGCVSVAEAVLHMLPQDAAAPSPGMKYKHYAPAATLTLLCGSREDYAARVNEYYETLQRAGEEDGFYAMCFDEDVSLLEAPTISYGVAYDYPSQAQNLFDVLRQLDKLQATEVYVHAPEPEEMGLAVYNRLLRAAAFRVVHL